MLDLLRAHAWATSEAWRVRRQLRSGCALSAIRVSEPSGLRAGREASLDRLLARLRFTCLVRSLVLQAWAAGFGSAPDVVIGVRWVHGAFRSHAWLSGTSNAEFVELARVVWRPDPDS